MDAAAEPISLQLENLEAVGSLGLQDVGTNNVKFKTK